MKVVIDIPEEIYKASQIVDVKYEDVIQIPLELIANGTPLDGVLQEIQKEIDKTPIGNKSAYEITLLNAYRFRIHQIIDKHIKEIERSDTE